MANKTFTLYALPKHHQKLAGANMDIDMASRPGDISWEQTPCPWNVAEKTTGHKCAVKNTSICDYFCGVEYPDNLLCSYPNINPCEEKNN